MRRLAEYRPAGAAASTAAPATGPEDVVHGFISPSALVATVAFAAAPLAAATPRVEQAGDGAAQAVVTRRPVAPQPIRYALEPAADVLAAVTEPARIALLEKLNRTDAPRLARHAMLIVPDRWDADELDYTPLPRRVAALAAHRKALVVHQPQQVFGAYEHGELVRWGPVSTGRREHPTPSGEFHLNWRSRGRHSTVNPAWYMEWYYNFHNERGISLHQYELPGRPASHACVRLLERDARWIYDWGEGWTLDARGWRVLEHGTPLWVVGAYDFDAPPPWLDAAAPHPAIELPAGEFDRR
jgi:lipoprotein-anchoring transpeptidase ErfK/SrfK